MPTRITTAHLEGKVRIINGHLGFSGDEGYSTIGLIVLDGAYGATGVHRYMNNEGGVTDLMGGHFTKKDVANFLDGMIAAFRIRDES